MKFVARARAVDAFSDTVAVVWAGTDATERPSPSCDTGAPVLGALAVASAVLWAGRCIATFAGVAIMAFTYLGLLVAYSVVGANPVAVAGLLGAAGSGESILALAHGVSVHPNALSVVVT